jgi:hypothetical protein
VVTSVARLFASPRPDRDPAARARPKPARSDGRGCRDPDRSFHAKAALVRNARGGSLDRALRELEGFATDGEPDALAYEPLSA